MWKTKTASNSFFFFFNQTTDFFQPDQEKDFILVPCLDVRLTPWSLIDCSAPCDRVMFDLVFLFLFFSSTSLWWTTVVFLLQTLSIESNPRLGRIGYGLRSNFYKWDIDFFFLFLIRGFYYIRADHGFEYLTSICSDFRSKINPGWLAGTFETWIFGWNSCRKM